MSGIVWLASYPKSGNTWLRALLTNAIRPGKEPAHINALIGTTGGPSRKLFDDWSGIKSVDLTPAEIESARPKVYQALAASKRETIYSKVHDAFTYNVAGEPLFPLGATKAVIYIVRHPADVVVSYAHHRGCTVAEAIALLANPRHTLAASAVGGESQFPQPLLSWSGHVASWLNSPHRVHCVRYEDMHRDTFATLKGIFDFLEEDVPQGDILRATQYASFTELRRQEAESGFIESPSSRRTFFRSGKPGARKGLNDLELRSIYRAHLSMMQRLGYGVDQNE